MDTEEFLLLGAVCVGGFFLLRRPGSPTTGLYVQGPALAPPVTRPTAQTLPPTKPLDMGQELAVGAVATVLGPKAGQALAQAVTCSPTDTSIFCNLDRVKQADAVYKQYVAMGKTPTKEGNIFTDPLNFRLRVDGKVVFGPPDPPPILIASRPIDPSYTGPQTTEVRLHFATASGASPSPPVTSAPTLDPYSVSFAMPG